MVIQLFSDAYVAHREVLFIFNSCRCSYIEADLEARLVSEALFFDAVSFAAKQMRYPFLIYYPCIISFFRYDDSVKFMDRLLTLYLKDNNKATFSNRSRSLCMYIIVCYLAKSFTCLYVRVQIILLRKPDLKQAVAKFSALCMYVSDASE